MLRRILAGAALAGLVAAPALAGPNPATWVYSRPGNVSTATYPGNVTVAGSLDGYYTAPGGGVAQPVSTRLAKQIFATDYGVKCDGVTNDTAALGAAYSAAQTLKATLFLPNGTCLTSGNAIASSDESSQFAIIGYGRNQTTLKKYGTNSNSVLTLGSSTATNFMANIEIRGVTIDANTYGSAALETYDLVRSHIHDVALKNAKFYGYYSAGGIANTIANSVISNSPYGLFFTKFTSLAGGGWPNLIRVSNSQIVDNSTYGISFNYGRMLILDGNDIEGNGTTLGASQGGLLVGENCGQEVSINDPFTQCVVGRGNWFEANKGIADATFYSGINSLIDTQFASTAAQTTYDLNIAGGRYFIRGANSVFGKANNLLEGAGTTSGNVIEQFDASNLNYNSAKTSLFSPTFNVLTGLTQVGTAVINGSAAPSLSGCAGGSVLAGSNNAGGTIEVGAGLTSCGITFANAYPNKANCTVTPITALGGLTYYLSALSTAGLTVTYSGAAGGQRFAYTCTGA